MTPHKIRLLAPDDHDQWRELYQGYVDFYQVASTSNGLETTWFWLTNARQVCRGLVAEQLAQLIGLAHFRGMPSPLRGQMIGFLDDLFVSPNHRCGGVAAALISAVYAEVKAEGWAVVRWITLDNNYQARGLYDKLAEKTDWTLYEMAEK